MPRTYRPENTDVENIGGIYSGHPRTHPSDEDLAEPSQGLTIRKTQNGYSGSHIFLACMSLLAAVIAFAHRRMKLTDFVESDKVACGGESMKYYLGYYQNEGEEFFVILVLVTSALLLAETLLRTAHVYPYEKMGFVHFKWNGEEYYKGTYKFNVYRAYLVVEAVMEMVIVAFTVLSLYAEMRQDDDSKTGAGSLWSAAGCPASQGQTLREAIADGGYEHSSTWGALFVGLYLLVKRVIGIEHRQCQSIFDLDTVEAKGLNPFLWCKCGDKVNHKKDLTREEVALMARSEL